MDRGYVLFNTIVYGGMALVFSTFYAYSKIQHLAIGAIMIFLGYVMYDFITNWFQRITLVITLGLVGFYLLTNRLLLRFFPNEKSRDLLSIVFTLAISMLVENSINMIYGPSSVSLSGIEIGLPVLIWLFLILNIVMFYIFGMTLFGKMMKGIFERRQVVSSLGIRVGRLQNITFFTLLIILALVAGLILVKSNIRSSDAIFYLIKWIGISILVWFSQKQWVFIGALLYVLLEYAMFIWLGRPIMRKESLILVIVLLVLLFKPEWLFSFGKRSI